MRLSQEFKDEELGARLRENARRGVLFNPNGGRPKYKIYVKDFRWAGDLWPDVGINDRAEDYPTAKSPRLLNRIIENFSAPGDIVLDCFIGSGTTAAVAQKLGRRWIGCDINKGAIQTTSRRLQGIIRAQISGDPGARQEALIADDGAAAPSPTPPPEGEGQQEPAQRSFTLWRVNDYDLHIQHNEAVALVGEYLGIERTKADGFFDGTLGNKLVRVVPFDHPLGPLDLEAVKRELEARGGEEVRSVVMVCLGKQLAADDWLGAWNKFRAVTRREDGTNAPIEFVNKIEVIDVRSDPKYGGFIAHEPAQADVRIQRRDGAILVTIQDFISPTIVKRLEMDMGLFRAQVTDWRAMVNSVEIDTAYHGDVFTIALSDIPERKADLVAGRYTLPAPEGPTAVAVKITDMLGEEVLVTERVAPSPTPPPQGRG
jgi:hypothetical protein